MSLPKYVDTNKLERIGVNKVALMLSEMGLIFRETSSSDTGIDGQVEEVDEDNNATGRIMAIQIKSGSSYLHENGNSWTFYIDEAHKNYWRLFPIPVMLLVYNPNDKNVYFVDAKYALNTTEKTDIPKKNVLCEGNKVEFLKTLGGSLAKCSEIDDVFRFMLQERCNETSFSVSFLELFISGLTNLCHDLYYDVSVAMDIAESKSNGVGISVNHDFLWEYIMYIVKENLVEINFHACLYDYEERQMQPRFIAPLTYRGRQLLEYVSQLENNYLEKSDVPIVFERLINLQFDYYSVKSLNRISELQSLLLAKMGN